ncbi:MAG: YARHG domain-containing protein [Crocinitomicaceae bacterium]|nr:YARHG domain-containing protein [Crocinitomicaceae bacterium]
MKFLTFSFSLLASIQLFANDGAFFAKGNQLIPIVDADISVQKEILKITRKSDNTLDISVYYEFFNPGNTKEVLVGFEATSPDGDVNASPKNGRHPYIREFSVEMNGLSIPFDVAMVDEEIYYENDRFKPVKPESLNYDEHPNYVSFYYVYHFQAKFKPGVNIVKHTYNFDLSSSVMTRYEFDYVLTAANRWANEQIDDFTLKIDMGVFEEFRINRTFFDHASEWLITGLGKAVNKEFGYGDVEDPVAQFAITDGAIVFSKKNFQPKGELQLIAWRHLQDASEFNYKEHDLPFAITAQNMIPEPVDAMSKKVLRNLPFARRGYIFKTKELNEYFRSQYWYIPNPETESSMDDLTPEEKEWVQKWSQ